MLTRRLSIFFLLAYWPSSFLFSQNTFPIPTGNVGIQTPVAPRALLDLGPAAGIKALFYGAGGSEDYYWGTGVNLGQSPNEASIFIGGAAGSCCGSENFAIVSANQISWPYTSFQTRFVLNSISGNVGIGTLNVADPAYKLFVETGIRTRRVVVDQAAWPDYVFYKGYHLPSLDSVSGYIRANNHLPDIPSADSVARSGLDLGGNQVALLKKIEELTLYIIEQDKSRQAQDRRMEEQERKIERLEKLVGRKAPK